jgi:hypothetical protein
MRPDQLRALAGHAVQPAAHRGKRHAQLDSDLAQAHLAGAGQQRRADHLGHVHPPQQPHRRQQHVRSPARPLPAAAPPGTNALLHPAAATQPPAPRPTPRAEHAPHPGRGQASSPAASASSTRSGSVPTISTGAPRTISKALPSATRLGGPCAFTTARACSAPSIPGNSGAQPGYRTAGPRRACCATCPTTTAPWAWARHHHECPNKPSTCSSRASPHSGRPRRLVLPVRQGEPARGRRRPARPGRWRGLAGGQRRQAQAPHAGHARGGGVVRPPLPRRPAAAPHRRGPPGG